MNRKTLNILFITGILFCLTAACGKVDRGRKNYIACSQEIIEFSETLALKSGSTSEKLKEKVLEIVKKYNFQDLNDFITAYKKNPRNYQSQMEEILQQIEDKPGRPEVNKTYTNDSYKESPHEKALPPRERTNHGDVMGFLTGCQKNDKGRVLYYLDKEVDVNARDERNGRTGLHYAAERLNTEILKILIAKGADFELRCNDGYAPIHLAVKPMSDIYFIIPAEVNEKRWETIDLLLQAGADINAQTNTGGFNILGLYLLNSPEILLTPSGMENSRLKDPLIDFFLKNGIDINTRTTTDIDMADTFIPAGSTLLDIMTALKVQRIMDFLKKHGAIHGTWAKYYLEGKEKEVFLKSQEPPGQQAEPGPGTDRANDESQKDKKSPSEVVIATYMAANKGNYAETEQYIHSGFLAGIQDANPAQALKKRWDKVTRDKKIEKVEILGQEIQKEEAAVYFKIHFKDGKVKVAKEQLLKENGHWKITTEK